jgi:hypothetical protein
LKLSIVIICWNDWNVIKDCLESIYGGAPSLDFEVIVSDNGSTDGSPELIRQNFPRVKVVENKANLGFGKGNNAGIEVASGEYTWILNPDTIVHSDALDAFVAFADRHPEAGAFGCRVLNPDGSYQISARPFPTLWRDWLGALYLRGIARIFPWLASDFYTGWKGETERTVDWQSGCCVLFRTNLLKKLGAFDEQFFYHFEEVDLCRRVWDAGFSIRFTPGATITHLGGQSVGRFPIRFELEKCRNRYRYYYKHFGPEAARNVRYALLARILIRRLGYKVIAFVKPSETITRRLEMYRAVLEWNSRIDPAYFVERGEEPRQIAPYSV